MVEAPRQTGVAGWVGQNVATVIVIVTLAANVVAQWAVINDRLSDIKELREDVAGLTNRMSVLEVRYENLKDIVLELRRQSGLLDEPLR